MKYFLLQADGMGDYPVPELNNLTPLARAKTPFMDLIASAGKVGNYISIPEDMEPGSDVGTLSLLGYELSSYSGRAPIECAGAGVDLEKDDVAFRMNLVSLEGEFENAVMADYSAGHISQEIAGEIVQSIKEKFESDSFKFFPGLSYRHIFIWKKGRSEMLTTPPHDIVGKKIEPYLPRGEGAHLIIDLMKEIFLFLKTHQFSKPHRANAVWLWGQGKKMELKSLKERTGLKGAVIAAVNLIKGVGRLAGLDLIEVEGATGDVDTNYRGKGEAAVNALMSGYDFCFLHIEAPDEAGHRGDPFLKVKTIEKIDEEIVSRIVKLAEKEDMKICITSDHRTPVSVKTHTRDPVPFALCTSNNLKKREKRVKFSEHLCEGSLFFRDGVSFFDFFLNGE